MNFFDHIMTRCVLACVYAVAALLTINGQDLNAVKKISMASVTVHDGMHGPPHILRGKNLSLLPYFASGRESISMCIFGNYSYYWKILEPLGFIKQGYGMLWLNRYQSGNSSESALWDCTTEKNAEDFKAEVADLLKNFQVNLIIADPKEERMVHYFISMGKEANASRRYSMGTLLTLRPEKPTSVEGVEVQLMWTLYFLQAAVINGSGISYVVTLTENNQSLTPALTIEFKSGITINYYLNVVLQTRTPIWQFPLQGVKINLENGSTIDVKEEDILIDWEKEGSGWGFYPFKDFTLAGRSFSVEHPSVVMLLKVRITSRVTSIKIIFNDTLGKVH
ncbi:uncharacterized protein LOC124163832 [Ischnura elegans]|uniref:uncharacterized protein LOC124163832 n=1 Tax=Ischnura elegans TaxID=197161 RepID=UPI001ED86C23|nr:uncharacterized protein LOC124163832 [Ischnura elegans]